MLDNLQEQPFISIISPVYNAEKIVPELVKRIEAEIEKITSNYEIILVDDFSPDNSWEVIDANCKRNKKVKGIKLSRNFGQHNAITVGLIESTGDVIVIMDCDLQDDPKHIKILLNEYYRGNQIVFTRRLHRKHSFRKRITAKIYNALFHVIADKNYDLNVGSLVMFSKQVLKEFIKLKEHDKLYIQALKWLGFKHTYVSVEHRERFEGTSSYKLDDLIRVAIQGWVSNSEKLLHLSIKTGILFTTSSFIALLIIVYFFFTKGYQSGWPSLISTILLSTGLILTSLGVLGIYIGKIFNEVRNRPSYVIEKKINI